MKKDKLAVIGAGNVGATTAYTAMCGGLFSEIVIIDINKEKASGEALDMMHGVSFVSTCRVYAGDYSDCAGADVIVITAGAAQAKNETRRDLLRRNSQIFKGIVGEIIRYCDKNVYLLVVTNPVDVLSYLTFKISGLESSHVIGSGTVLDSARFKYGLSQHTGIDTHDIDAFILGEHGDSEMPLWSKTTIAGMSIPEFCVTCGKCDGRKMEGIFEDVKNAAYDIIAKKGSTFYAVALAANTIMNAMLSDSNSILTVSTFLSGQYGLSDLYISVPTVINSKGAAKVLEVPMSEGEHTGLIHSGKTLKKLIGEIGF